MYRSAKLKIFVTIKCKKKKNVFIREVKWIYLLENLKSWWRQKKISSEDYAVVEVRFMTILNVWYFTKLIMFSLCHHCPREYRVQLRFTSASQFNKNYPGLIFYKLFFPTAYYLCRLSHMYVKCKCEVFYFFSIFTYLF